MAHRLCPSSHLTLAENRLNSEAHGTWLACAEHDRLVRENRNVERKEGCALFFLSCVAEISVVSDIAYEVTSY